MHSPIVLALLITCALCDTSTAYLRYNQTCNSDAFWNSQSCIQCQPYCTCTTPYGCDLMLCPPGSVKLGSPATQQCVNCPLGCTQCDVDEGDGNFECKQCGQGYQLISDICVLQTSAMQQQIQAYDVQLTYNQQVNRFASCVLMDTDTSFCTQCGSSYFLNEYAMCEACTMGCLQCNSRGTCSKCQTSQFWQPNQQMRDSLAQLTRLQQYNNVSITVEGSYAEGAGSCAPCIDRAAQDCTNQGLNSTSCMSAYFLDGSQTYPRCSACAAGALNCTSTTAASLCAVGLFLQSGLCQQCYGNTKAPRVSPCLSCSTGLSASCDTCNTDGGYIKINKDCMQCQDSISACQTCNSVNNAISCAMCQNGYYRLIGANNIATCIACTTIQTTQGVLFCYKDDYGTQANPIVSQCNSGYKLVQQTAVTTLSMVCQPNKNSCLTMVDSNGLCKTCYDTYQLVNGACASCLSITGCQKCTVSTNNKVDELVCQACASGNTDYLTVDLTVNYALNSAANTCFRCPDACGSCSPDSKCQTCRSGYTLVGTTCTLCTVAQCSQCGTSSNSCTQCQDGYFLFTSNNVLTCLPCAGGCSQCGSDGKKCSACISGFYLKNGGCNLGNQYCAVFKSDGTCTTCQYGFRKQGGTCYPCIDFESGYVCGKNAGSGCWSTLLLPALLVLLSLLQ